MVRKENPTVEIVIYMGYSRKNPHPHDGSHASKPHRKGLMTLEIQIGGSVVLNLTLHRGLRAYIHHSLNNRHF